jgi:hypothetical protein
MGLFGKLNSSWTIIGVMTINQVGENDTEIINFINVKKYSDWIVNISKKKRRGKISDSNIIELKFTSNASLTPRSLNHKSSEYPHQGDSTSTSTPLILPNALNVKTSNEEKSSPNLLSAGVENSRKLSDDKKNNNTEKHIGVLLTSTSGAAASNTVMKSFKTSTIFPYYNSTGNDKSAFSNAGVNYSLNDDLKITTEEMISSSDVSIENSTISSFHNDSHWEKFNNTTNNNNMRIITAVTKPETNFPKNTKNGNDNEMMINATQDEINLTNKSTVNEKNISQVPSSIPQLLRSGRDYKVENSTKLMINSTNYNSNEIIKVSLNDDSENIDKPLLAEIGLPPSIMIASTVIASLIVLFIIFCILGRSKPDGHCE